MGTLRNQMTDAMKLRRFSPRTQQSYLAAVTALANYYHAPPDQLDFEKIKAYLLHLTVERALSWSTCNVAVSAFRFFYSEVLGWEKVCLPLPPCKKPKTLPVIFSRQELERLFACAGSPKYRVLLLTTYAAGLRVSEVVNLKPADIDSGRQMVRVEQAKGAKRPLCVLPAYSKNSGSTGNSTGLTPGSSRALEIASASWPAAWRSRSTTRPNAGLGSPTVTARTCCVTALPRTCSKPAWTCALFSRSWAIPLSLPPCVTCRSEALMRSRICWTCSRYQRPSLRNRERFRTMSLVQQQQAAGGKRSPELADIFRAYGQSYRQAQALPRAQLKVMHAIESCRTAALGGHLQQCDSCGYQQPAYNSCRNRHCPKCGSLAKAQWLEDRKADLLPVGYFHLVFTLPHELNPLLLVNKKVLCDSLFKAVSQTLLEFGRTHLGGSLGFICVLHTWDQTLRDHFHLHCLIPGGALSFDGSQWIAARQTFLFSVKALSLVFRGKFIDLIEQTFIKEQLQFPGRSAPLAQPDAFADLVCSLRQKPWVVYAKRPFSSPRKSSTTWAATLSG